MLLVLSVLKLAVPWNETYPDTTKLGKQPSGACEGCLAHHVLPVLYGLAETPSILMAKWLPVLWWEDCRTWHRTAPLQVVSQQENHVGSPTLAPSRSLGCLAS